MYLIELGQAVRGRRKDRKISQATLAAMVGLSRESISRLESGTINDLGIKKIAAITEALGLTLSVTPREAVKRPDYIARAVSTANVSLRERLYPDELIQALLTGQCPRGREAHLYAVLEDLSEANIEGLIGQVVELTGQAARVRDAVARLRRQLVPWQ